VRTVFKIIHVPQFENIFRFHFTECLTIGVLASDGWRERLGNGNRTPEGNQEPLVVNNKVGRLPSEHRWASPWNVKLFPFSALTLLTGWQERYFACKKLGVALLVVTIGLELCTSYSSLLPPPPSSLASKNQEWRHSGISFNTQVVLKNGR